MFPGLFEHPLIASFCKQPLIAYMYLSSSCQSERVERALDRDVLFASVII